MRHYPTIFFLPNYSICRANIITKYPIPDIYYAPL